MILYMIFFLFEKIYSKLGSFVYRWMRNPAEELDRLTVNAKVLGSIPASSDTFETEVWQMKQCWKKYLKIFFFYRAKNKLSCDWQGSSSGTMQERICFHLENKMKSRQINKDNNWLPFHVLFICIPYYSILKYKDIDRGKTGNVTHKMITSFNKIQYYKNQPRSSKI